MVSKLWIVLGLNVLAEVLSKYMGRKFEGENPRPASSTTRKPRPARKTVGKPKARS